MTDETPRSVDLVVGELVEDARIAFGPDLIAAVLFGSAAEGRLRPTSDVNLMFVLARFDAAKADVLREPARFARAAIRLAPMFVLESEIPAAAEAFAVKFADLSRRHKVLFGPDPFAALEISRDAGVRRVKQVLLNLVLRMRERYVLTGLREEQLVRAIADFAGPLRATAAAILELEGGPVLAAREALQHLVRALGRADAESVLTRVSEAREFGVLAEGTAGPTLLALIEIGQALRERAQKL